ncbi:MAG: YfcE family phosphodiesterase [Tissierellia bacterium]|nr:YfcE family phosphodiesterase [Bacillota bacterium]NLL23679.1 YfcE family phosphodiesterase [Tissierellia bacterium]
MKILIFSDSHGSIGKMEEWIREECPDKLIHLGDYYDDLPGALRVPGNCDPYAIGARVRAVTIEGVRIFLTHGHRHGVKAGLRSLMQAGKEAGARIVLFGHTHTPHISETEGMILLNPGSAKHSGISLEITDEINVTFIGEGHGQEMHRFSLESFHVDIGS